MMNNFLADRPLREELRSPMSFGSVKSGSKVELPPQKVEFIKSMPVARIQDFLAAFKAQKRAEDPD